MLSQEAAETKESLKRINNVCRGIVVALKITFVVICLFWIFATGLMVFSLVHEGGSTATGSLGVMAVVLHIARGVVVALLLIVLLAMFSESTKGESPFTMNQSSRLRIVAGLLVLYGILEVVFSLNSAVFSYGVISAGYVSTEKSAIITINFAPFVVSAVVFAFSYVFKYGVLLQEFSDETL